MELLFASLLRLRDTAQGKNESEKKSARQPLTKTDEEMAFASTVATEESDVASSHADVSIAQTNLRPSAPKEAVTNTAASISGELRDVNANADHRAVTAAHFAYGDANFTVIRNEEQFFVDNSRFIKTLEQHKAVLFLAPASFWQIAVCQHFARLLRLKHNARAVSSMVW